MKTRFETSFWRKCMVLLALMVLFGVQLACSGTSNVGVKVGDTAPQEGKLVTFKVGDQVLVNDKLIVLNSVETVGMLTTANFTITNNGVEDTYVSATLDFKAKDADGVELKKQYTGCDYSGSLIAADKVKFNVCLKSVNTPTFRIYYEPDWLGEGATVWEVSK